MSNIKHITLHCTDNDQKVDAEVLYEARKSITALINGEVRVTLHQNFKKGNVYVGNVAGREFVYEEK